MKCQFKQRYAALGADVEARNQQSMELNLHAPEKLNVKRKTKNKEMHKY